jgi:hypothetical protein
LQFLEIDNFFSQKTDAANCKIVLMCRLRACFRLTNNSNINRSVSDGLELSIRKSSTSAGCISSGEQQGRRWPSQLLYFYSAMSSAMVATSLQNDTSSDSSKAAIAAAVKVASQAALQEKRFQGERANIASIRGATDTLCCPLFCMGTN